jgi:hypothetical protein
MVIQYHHVGHGDDDKGDNVVDKSHHIDEDLLLRQLLWLASLLAEAFYEDLTCT